MEAYREGVKKITLQFEYTGHFQKLHDAPNQLSGYDKWHSIGQTYAERFKPNSAWLKSQGVSDWVVTIFAAFNEPDDEKPADALPITELSSYYSGLKGLADGVHSVYPALAGAGSVLYRDRAFRHGDETRRVWLGRSAPKYSAFGAVFLYRDGPRAERDVYVSSRD